MRLLPSAIRKRAGVKTPAPNPSIPLPQVHTGTLTPSLRNADRHVIVGGFKVTGVGDSVRPIVEEDAVAQQGGRTHAAPKAPMR